MKKIKYALAVTAILALIACASVIGGGENGCKKDNSRH